MKGAWSYPRVATAGALLVWAGAFWFIIGTDRLSLYLAARTTWLAPLGAVTLTAAGVGRLITSRVPNRESLSRGQFQNLAFLVVPAVVILALPPMTLGSYAAGRRSASVAGAYAPTTGASNAEGDLSLLDIFAMSYSNNLEALAPRAGTKSSFVGFVSREGSDAADEFQLNRFTVSCCPGDAVLISLRVVGAPPGAAKVDDWVRVTGNIYPIGDTVVVDATDVERVRRPKRPYLD